MGRDLILDSDVVIELGRGASPAALGLREDDDTAIAAITYAELWASVELAPDPETGRRRQQLLDGVLIATRVLDYTRSTSMHHARLLAYARRTGRPRSAYDLQIAAHALESGRALVSRDAAARFGDLPGVQVA